MASAKLPAVITRRRFLRLSSLGVAGAGLSSLLVACGIAMPGDELPPEAAAPAMGESTQTTITFWYWDDIFKNMVASFETAHPTITLKLEQQFYPNAHQLLQSALETGSGAPDVFMTDLGGLATLANQSGMADLGGAPFGGSSLKDAFVPSLWAHGISEGRLVAIPWNLGPGSAWYRADLFEAAGLPTDPERVEERAKTWTDWFALNRELHQKNSNTRLIGDASSLFQVAVEQQGHGWMDGNRLLIAEKGIPAAQQVATAREQEIPALVEGVQWDREMREDRIAGMINASWTHYFLLSNHPQTAGKWRVIPTPGGNFSLGALYLMIPAQSRQQEAAWEFVRYLCASNEGQNAAFAASGVFPAYMPAWNDPLYSQPVDFFGGQPAYRVWANAAGALPPSLMSIHQQQINQIVQGALNNVLYKTKTPEEAMEAAEASALKQIAGSVA